MKRLMLFTLFLSFCTYAYCDSQSQTAGIFPGAIHSPAQNIVQKETKGNYFYKSFDTEKLRNRAASNERFVNLIEQAKQSVAVLIAKSDDEIRDLILPANVTRAFMVHRSGCPVHGGGTGVYKPFGTSVDISHPHQVRCPLGDEWYPNEEFPDDGQGWLDNRPDSPTKGERFYFTGWFQHWFLTQVGRYLKTLAQLWLLTGDELYCNKAEVLLKRFTEVYPGLDCNELTYDGTDWGVYVKMTGTYWEGNILLDLAKSVEILLPVLPGNLIEDVHTRVYQAAFAAYRSKPASSNWGNCWNPALAKFATVTGDSEMLEFMLNDHPAAQAPVLDNQFFRDGFPYEASLSYASTYHNVALNVAEAMGENGSWIWDNPHVRASFHSFADVVCLDRFTHFAADMGSINNNGWTLPSTIVKEAYLVYRTPELARYLVQSFGIYGEQTIRSLDDLFRESLDTDEVRRKAAMAKKMKSTVAPLRGLAVLRTGEGKNRAALFMDYGYAHAAHSHADRLNINLFAAGREFIPEMGYPEYMDHIAPATGGWTTHTVCHATVEVNEKRQAPGVFGDLHAFVDIEGLRFIDASCEDAYVHCDVDRFRRTLLLLDISNGCYVVDLFRVRGGTQHDYLFHGPPVEMKLESPPLSPPREGTLAGKNVPFGFKPDELRPYDINNSGYQYLYDVQECKTAASTNVRWTMDDGVKFNALFIPRGTETFIKTLGYPRPSTKSLPPMPFLIRRHSKITGKVESQFVTLLSVEKDKPMVDSARRLALTSDSSPSAACILVNHASGKDIILSTVSTDGTAVSADGRFKLKGLLGTASWKDNRLVRMTLIGGTEFTVDGKRVQLESPVFETTIKQVYDDRLVLAEPLPAGSDGQILLVDRGQVRSVYHIKKSEGRTVYIGTTTWIGRGRTGSVDEKSGTILDGRKVFPLGDTSYPLGDEGSIGARNYYAGAWLVPEGGGRCYRLIKGGNNGFVLDTNQDISRIKNDFPIGSDFLIYDIGPSDRVTLITYKQITF